MECCLGWFWVGFFGFRRGSGKSLLFPGSFLCSFFIWYGSCGFGWVSELLIVGGMCICRVVLG